MRFDKERCFLLRSDEQEKKALFCTDKNELSPAALKALRAIAVVSYIFMLFMQIRNVICFGGEPTSDASRYVGDAMANILSGTWYPTASDFVGGGVAGTGFVNYLIFLFKITDNVKIAYFANILLVEVLLFSTVYIAEKITGSVTVKYITVTFFCLFGTFWSEVCVARTEIFFTSLAVFALALAVKDSRFSTVLSGMIFAYANWARPLAVAFLVAVFWLFLYKGVRFRQYIKLFGAFAVTALLLSTFTYVNSGQFVYQPTIASGNFLIGANEDADGSYDSIVFTEGKAGYIPPEEKQKMSADEINAIYSKAATDWIKENPTDYLKLLPKKLFYFLATETYSGDSYFDNEKATSSRAYISELLSLLTGSLQRKAELGDFIMLYTQGFYMLVLFLFFTGVIYSMKKGYWRSMSFIYGIFLIGVASSLYTVGGGRYHFPFIFVLIITSSVLTDAVLSKKFKNHTKKP